MAQDNTVTVAFNADTSGLQEGIAQANAALAGMQSSANNSADAIDSVFQALEKTSSQVLKGVLTGTQTWQQAITRSLSNILASYANTIFEIPVDWIRGELEMTASTEEGNAARTESDTAAAATSAAAQSSRAAATITSDAALTYGGVYAFLAPEMGPAASGPAAASEAQVLSQVSLASLDVGAWNIPQNMPAFLHAGEMVVPADFASGLRSGGNLGGGGGDMYTINVNAIDTQTGAQFLKNNAAIIASTLSSQARNFNKNIPSWKS